MNIFSQFSGNNGCLWILILLLLAASCSGNGLECALAGSCWPILIALVYSMWRNGTLANLLYGSNGNGCSCGCNG